jgi:hypothetical protein
LENNNISDSRCFNHAVREAVAKCPQCGRFFCRECVSEHEGRVICASCLARIAGIKHKKRFNLSGTAKIFQLAAGILILWCCFYLMGKALLSIPSVFHEKTMWSEVLKEDNEQKDNRNVPQ